MIDAQLHIYEPGDDEELDINYYHATITGKIGQGRVAIYHDPITKVTDIIHIDKDGKADEYKNTDFSKFFEIMNKAGFTDENYK